MAAVRPLTGQARDTHLRSLARTTRVVVVASVLGTVGLAAAVARAIPGHSATARTPNATTRRGATSSQNGSLESPSQAPQSSSASQTPLVSGGS